MHTSFPGQKEGEHPCSPAAPGAHLPHHSPETLRSCSRAEHRHFQVFLEVPQGIPRDLSTILPHPGTETGTHCVGGTVCRVLVLRRLVPAVGRDTVIHKPAARRTGRNTLRGWGLGESLLGGVCTGTPTSPSVEPHLSFAPAAPAEVTPHWGQLVRLAGPKCQDPRSCSATAQAEGAWRPEGRSQLCLLLRAGEGSGGKDAGEAAARMDR